MPVPEAAMPHSVNARVPAFIFSFLVMQLWCGSAVLAASLTLTLTDQNHAALDDAIIYISNINGKHAATTPQNVIVDQLNEMFVPHVRAIPVGSRVSFPNSDHIRHHVYSFSEAKTFELPLYTGVPTTPVQFDKAGLVTLGCNIHDHMLGYILVVDTPWYAEVHDGKATISNLPAGQLAVVVWHPRLAQEQALQLNLTVTADQNATLAQQLELRPERMVRRAPRRGGNRY